VNDITFSKIVAISFIDDDKFDRHVQKCILSAA